MKRHVKKSSSALALTLAALLTASLASTGTYPERVEAEETNYGLSNPKTAYNYRETVTFGNYWQEDTNGNGVADKNDDKTPITWQILEKYDDDTALVVSDKILDVGPYFEGVPDGNGGTDYSCTWKTSTVRKWLNDEFYNNAFISDEKVAIIEEDIENADNPTSGTEGGDDTKDNVFLLSLDDVKNTAYCFDESWYTKDQGRLAKDTAYVKNICNSIFDDDETPNWWLRSPGITSEYAACVYYKGFVDVKNGNYVVGNCRIRPALRINLKSSYVKEGDKARVSGKGSEWDIVTFGKYDGKDISWRVLNVSGDNAFLVSDKILTTKIYNDEETDITWKDSTIRAWLNGEFLTESFSEDEQNMILKANVKNDDNEYYGTEGGEDTKDKIFLLSLKDVIQSGYGFLDQYGSESETRVAKNLEGAAGWWWLRSCGDSTYFAAFVDDSGYVSSGGAHVYYSNGGIRPALYINLKSSAWTKGEKVIAGDPSGGKEEPVVNPSSKVAPPTDPTAKPTVTPTNQDKTKAPAKVALKSVKNIKGKKLTAKWKKVTGAKGYQIQYSTNKKFKKAKTKTTKKTTFTIKKLKKKKTYYVRVRAYTIDASGKKVPGKWSKVKKVRIKK